MSSESTCVLILKDFAIYALPTVPPLYTNRIDPNVWKEFTNQISQRINQTYCQKHNMTNLASIRCRLQTAYWVCAPSTCILGYAAYCTLIWSSAFVLAIILALGAFASLITAISTAIQCGNLMKEYRVSCQQDLNEAFDRVNQTYNNSIYLSSARSTHRNNGSVQLGINVDLKVQHLNTSAVNTNVVYAPPFQMQCVVENGNPLQQPLVNMQNEGEGEEGAPVLANNYYTMQ